MNAFSRWERELPKLEADPRFKLLATTKERRAAFDAFCMNVAAEQASHRRSPCTLQAPLAHRPRAPALQGRLSPPGEAAAPTVFACAW